MQTEVMSISKAQQWHHVAGKRNPADHATRGIPLQDLEQLWLQLPEILLLKKFDWPQPKLLDDIVTQMVSTNTNKERTTTLIVYSTILHNNGTVNWENTFTSNKTQPIIDVSRFSEWHRLLRATARYTVQKN